MNLRQFFVGFSALLALFIGIVQPLDASHSSHRVKKYIKGGAPDGGDGSERYPFNTLAQAEASYWDTLVVLPSTAIIYGGIALSDGQDIRGIDPQTCRLASLDGSVNNGDVIVANGDNAISGITITSAYRCGIEALLARNLTVNNCSINSTNSSLTPLNYDYEQESTTVDNIAWSAICFFGGPQVSDTEIQPFNTLSGTFKLCDCSFANNQQDLIFGSGDSVSTGFVDYTYKREYEIENCQFSNTMAIASIIPYVAGGGYLFGSIKDCTLLNIDGTGIWYLTISGNNPNFPGRGNYDFGKNEVEDSSIRITAQWGVFLELSGNLTGCKGEMIVKDNRFYDVSSIGNTPPAIIENAYAAIQITIDPTASGNSIKWEVEDNRITDSTGLTPAIAAYFYGGNQKVHADIQHNKADGTTTCMDILFYGPGEALGDFYVANNAFTDNDSVLVVASAPDSPYTGLNVKVENNCFMNTGARNTPPYQQPPYDNGSYYGGAVIFGGADNTALEFIGANGTDLGNAIVDLGGGLLHSKGKNSFINTTGADTWVEPGLVLNAKRNWFGGSTPTDAGVGGTVVFVPVLTQDPGTCGCEH